MTPTPADLAAALETVQNTAYGRTYVRRTADGEQRSYLDDCELLARWLAENAERLRVVKPLEWVGDAKGKSSRAICLFGCVFATDCRVWLPGDESQPCDSLADGKAKAQSWYDERIAAALSPAFPAKEEEK